MSNIPEANRPNFNVVNIEEIFVNYYNAFGPFSFENLKGKKFMITPFSNNGRKCQILFFINLKIRSAKRIGTLTFLEIFRFGDLTFYDTLLKFEKCQTLISTVKQHLKLSPS